MSLTRVRRLTIKSVRRRRILSRESAKGRLNTDFTAAAALKGMHSNAGAFPAPMTARQVIGRETRLRPNAGRQSRTRSRGDIAGWTCENRSWQKIVVRIFSTSCCSPVLE